MKLIMVKYGDEAERKKIEYLISKYSARRVKDVVIEVRDADFEEFVKELYGKIPEDRLRVISGREEKVHVAKAREEIRMGFSTDADSVMQFLNYLIVRRKGTYRGPLGGFERYRLHTKKGLVELSIKTAKESGGLRLDLIIEGKADAATIVKDEMEKELENYRNSIGGN